MGTFGKMIILALIGLTAIPSGADAITTTFTDTGTLPAAITDTVDAFRAALGGGLNPNNPVSFSSGRREINWDGVPDAFSSPNAFPGDFFNQLIAGRARGSAFTTPGTGFQVSGAVGSVGFEFGNLNPTYPTLFTSFSSPKLFTPIGSSITDVNFFTPVDPTKPATVMGFGAVFTDVDLAGTTRIDYFGLGGNLLLSLPVPNLAGNETLSFGGAVFDSSVVSRVRLTTGNSAPGPNDGATVDIVVLDDFIYGEPQSVPEPPVILLLGSGVLGIIGIRRGLKP